MRFSFTTVSFLVSIVLLLVSLEGLCTEMLEKIVELPQTIGIWSRADTHRIIDSHTIFDYMDGAGELYLAYGFERLEVFEYTADQQQDIILVEVYVMKTSHDAFGLLSLDWGGEPVSLHTTPSVQSGPSILPPARALYGGGLLRIWADAIYARVLADRETTESKEAVLSLGRIIAANRAMPAEPELLKVFPPTLDSKWKLRKDRRGYFRSHLVLNSLYYLSHQNILNLDHTTEAATAPYESTSNAGTTQRVQVLVVNYATRERAHNALNTFHNAYLHEHPKGFDAPITGKHTNAFNIEDGWVGYSLDGTCLAIVFECPTRESAYSILQNFACAAIEKENEHGT